MAKNDKLLLDGIVDDRIALKQPSVKRDEAFEYLAFEQILKNFDLSTEELEHGTIDGRQDGGIDGFFILVNGLLIQDPESFSWPRTNSELHLILITCKHHDTFKQATLDALIATISEVIDFSIEDHQLTGAYSSQLISMRNNLKFAYRKLSPRLNNFMVSVYYASRGDTSELGDEVKARGRQICAIAQDCFGSCLPEFKFIGATELVELTRKIPNYTLELPFVDQLSKGERYVVLVRLSDYYKFVEDEGKLRRYLFESNVRAFMGMNRVNEDIKNTLQTADSADFWWLNNGVTILATSAMITGKSIQATDVQIVNGLQTTESIYHHFADQPQKSDDRCVLIKVIVTSDNAVRDSIIRATNNQTSVELASLHATDKIQRDIEEVMLRHGFYYERRKNFYANQGHPPGELVSPQYAAGAYIALILKKPHVASGLRSRFMRSDASYNAVFDDRAPLIIWPKIINIMRLVDEQLEIIRPRAKVTEKFLKNWRYITALIWASKYFGRYNYSAIDISGLDVQKMDPGEIYNIWDELNKISNDSLKGRSWSSAQDVIFACTELGKKWNISTPQSLSSAPFLTSITPEFVQSVKALLPPQPWKPGMHREICAKLSCEVPDYFSAVNSLVENGDFYLQKDGVLYDWDGNVVSFDPERVDAATLQLKPIDGEGAPIG